MQAGTVDHGGLVFAKERIGCEEERLGIQEGFVGVGSLFFNFGGEIIVYFFKFKVCVKIVRGDEIIGKLFESNFLDDDPLEVLDKELEVSEIEGELELEIRDFFGRELRGLEELFEIGEGEKLVVEVSVYSEGE